ncbi:hypothetical protein L484_017616 [Morus notabilis]|uniref:Uncharacterized protein n=2 Tax=Morus notabilis TaxID=981085 RepID=W9SWS3_9ROSA|nr:hypothetical protein L484_017616 [Morus notabilis]
MKLRLSFGSKNDKLEIPPSPVKEKPAGRIKDVALSSWSPSPSAKTFRDYDSKEEAFFDSQPWLESDCEDDFYSVNGDFTPSRGNTPVHQGVPMGSSKVSAAPFEARTPGTVRPVPAPFPTEKKRSLLDLFKESIRDDDEEEANNNAMASGRPEVKQAALDVPPKSARDTPFISGANSMCSSERTPNNGDAVNDVHRPMRSVQCCLPSLVACRSFSDRKKKMSPAIAVNGGP